MPDQSWQDLFTACVRRETPLPTTWADDLFAEFQRLDWQQPELLVFGKRHRTPRMTYWVGVGPFSYSGHTHHSQPATPGLVSLRNHVTQHIAPVNCVLLNKYRDGADTMGHHSDDEACFGHHPTIVTISLGAPRDVVFKPKNTRSADRFTVPNAHGDVWVMHGPCQDLFTHAVPARKRVLDQRISLTFRQLVDD